MGRQPALALREAGQGLPVLVVHGWTMSGFVEAEDFEPLFAEKSGYRRIYIDLPGMGDTPAGSITDLDSILDVVSAFIEEKILPSRFLLVGTSAGGYLAMALAYRFASAIDGLLLRVPLVQPDNSKRDLDPFKPPISNEEALSALPEDDRKLIGDVPIQTPGYISKLKHKAEKIWTPAVAESDAAVLDPIRNDPNRYKLTAPMHTPTQPFSKPTLILTGRQDTVVGYRDALPLVDCYSRATFVALDRADHGFPVDETDLFQALVCNWLWRVEELQQQVGTSPGTS